MFATWSARARVGAQVSCPLWWGEVAEVDPDDLTIATVPARIANQGNPWEEMYNTPQDIGVLLDWYERDLNDGLGDAPWPPVYPKMPNEPSRVAPSRAKE